MYPVVGEIIGWELLLVLAIAALLFGSSQLPKFARSLGSAKTEFEKGLKLGDDEKPDTKAADTPAGKDAGGGASTTTVPREPEKKPGPGDETSPTPT